MSDIANDEALQSVEIEDFSDLDGMREPDFVPENTASNAADDLARKEAKVAAEVAVAVVDSVLSVLAPAVKIDKAAKEKVSEKLEAVMYKYEINGIPPWLLAYKEELELVGVLGMVGFGVYAQIKAAKAAELKAAKAEKEGAENGEKSEPKAA